MIKNLLVTGALAVAVVFGVLLLKQPAPQLGSQQAPVVNIPAPVVNVPAPVVNVEAARVNVPAPVVNVNVPKQESVKLGAITGPEVPYNYFCIGGICSYYYSATLTTGVTGTTTPCSFLTPASTSTLVRTSMTLLEGTSTAATWSLASSTSPYATTTTFQQFTVSAGSATSLVSTTTLTKLNVFKPNSYLVWGVQGYTGGNGNGFILNGRCQATFEVI